MDIALRFAPGSMQPDINIDAPGLEIDHDLETALVMSIFTNRRANPDDTLYLNEDKRGWWGDTFNPIASDKIGSRLWLLERGKNTKTVLNQAREYVLEAVKWLVDDNIASSVNVETESINRYTLGIKVEVMRPDGAKTFHFRDVWDQL